MTNFTKARQERTVLDIAWDDRLKLLHEGRCVLLLGFQIRKRHVVMYKELNQ